MKKFEIPISDCGYFIVGAIGEDFVAQVEDGDEHPRYGVMIWYRSMDIAREAGIAAMAAHLGADQ